MMITATSSDTLQLTVSPSDAAKLLGIHRVQLWRLHKTNKLGPRPVYLGTKTPRFIVQELKEWLAAGAPPRDQWGRTTESVRTQGLAECHCAMDTG